MSIVIKPQPGPQEKFLSTPADIAIYGGAAGGGKSFALLMEPLRHINVKNFGGVIFRRTSPQIRNEGGLWDESTKLYLLTGATPTQHNLTWEFPSEVKIKFAHMQHEKDMYTWQGSQIPFIGFDELTHFTRKQFFYMLSRNRSTCGIKPYIRATTNPDATSWVRKFIAWYIDENTGYAIPERSGALRWFIQGDAEEDIIWADSKEYLIEFHNAAVDIEDAVKNNKKLPLSFTFISANIHDNQILLKTDPSYFAKLQGLPYIEREKLLGGNWNIDESKGIIRRADIKFYTVLPYVKYWVWSADTAVKEKQENDYSVLQLWAICENGYYLHYQWRDKVPYPTLLSEAKNLWGMQPGREFLIEDKSSGQQLLQSIRGDTNWPIIAMTPGKNMGKDKVSRVNFAHPLFEAGRVYVREGQPWTAELVEEWIAFPNAPHDDQVDPMSQFLSRRLLKGDTIEGDSIGGPVTTGGSISQMVSNNENAIIIPRVLK